MGIFCNLLLSVQYFPLFVYSFKRRVLFIMSFYLFIDINDFVIVAITSADINSHNFIGYFVFVLIKNLEKKLFHWKMFQLCISREQAYTSITHFFLYKFRYAWCGKYGRKKNRMNIKCDALNKVMWSEWKIFCLCNENDAG